MDEPRSREGLQEEFRRRLAAMRAEVLSTVSGTEDELAGLSTREPGAPVEVAAEQVAATVLEQMSGRERHLLDEVTDAQARLESGTFGICEGCARPIPLERLRALATTRLCVACQAKAEARGG
jgi:RNA polymerase-binding protein DksA